MIIGKGKKRIREKKKRKKILPLRYYYESQEKISR